jgi:hypothetical protein
VLAAVCVTLHFQADQGAVEAVHVTLVSMAWQDPMSCPTQEVVGVVTVEKVVPVQAAALAS